MFIKGETFITYVAYYVCWQPPEASVWGRSERMMNRHEQTYFFNVDHTHVLTFWKRVRNASHIHTNTAQILTMISYHAFYFSLFASTVHQTHTHSSEQSYVTVIYLKQNTNHCCVHLYNLRTCAKIEVMKWITQELIEPYTLAQVGSAGIFSFDVRTVKSCSIWYNMLTKFKNCENIL